MLIYLEAFVAAIIAGIVASLVSVLIEKFGGKLGGVLGSTPTTIIPAIVGFYLSMVTANFAQQSLLDFQRACLSVPPSLLIDFIFLGSWKYLPNILTARYPSLSNLQLLGLLIVISYSLWLSFTICLFLLFQAISPALIPVGELSTRIASASSLLFVIASPSQSPLFYLSVSSVLVHLFLGLAGTYSSVETPKSSVKVSLFFNCMRGLASGISIFTSIMLSQINGEIGGVATSFPAVFGTAMISVWVSSGNAVSLGAAEPLFLGAISISIFGLISAFLMPLFVDAIGVGGGITCSVFLSWLICVIFVSYPVHLWIQWRIITNNGLETDSEATIVVLETKDSLSSD